MSKIRKLPKLNMAASFRAESFNDQDNTIEVIFTTDEPVRRFSFFDGPFDEILGMKPSEVRMKRLDNGAPVLDSHNRFELKDQIGVVESASVDGEKGTAILRLSKRDSLKEVVQDIMTSSTYLIANKNSYVAKKDEVLDIYEKINKIINP